MRYRILESAKFYISEYFRAPFQYLLLNQATSSDRGVEIKSFRSWCRRWKNKFEILTNSGSFLETIS